MQYVWRQQTCQDELPSPKPTGWFHQKGLFWKEEPYSRRRSQVLDKQNHKSRDMIPNHTIQGIRLTVIITIICKISKHLK